MTAEETVEALVWSGMVNVYDLHIREAEAEGMLLL